MNDGKGYLQKNKALWNERTHWHVASPMYDMPSFLSGKSTLHEIELGLLGDVKGKKILHLQCHFGMDTLSLARMGAEVTGVDFSEAAIAKAKELTATVRQAAEFVCCNVYDAPQQVQGTFDMVFTSYGVIGWLPDLHKWAGVIAHFLKPGGILVFAEFHPVVWMYDNDFQKIEYSYFKTEPIEETEEGTYANRDAPIKNESITWNHSIAEVLTALLQNGLQLQNFYEYNYSPHDCFRHTQKIAEGKYIIKTFGDKVPLVFALKAVK